MVEPCAFIFLGDDELEKQKKIEQLQRKLFPPELRDLNFSLFYADDKDFTPQDLKEALMSFPMQGAKKRLLLIRVAHKLKSAFQEILLDTFRQAPQNIVVILDVPEAQGTEAFVNAFAKIDVQIARFKNEVTSNVFDLGRVILNHKTDAGLKILAGLLKNREKTEKILGALFWQWERGRLERRIPDETYRKGLKGILEADKRLKSSSSAFARQTLILESLVVKLSCLA